MNQLKADEALTVDDRDLRSPWAYPSCTPQLPPHVYAFHDGLRKRASAARVCEERLGLHACAKGAAGSASLRQRVPNRLPFLYRKAVRTLGCEAERLLPVIHSRFSLACRGRLGVQACALFPPEYEGRGETR